MLLGYAKYWLRSFHLELPTGICFFRRFFCEIAICKFI